MFNKEWICW